MYELKEIEYNFIINLTKFFLDRYKDGELKELEGIIRDVKARAPFVINMGFTFDKSIWLPDELEWYENLIEFKVQLVNELEILPFRLFLNGGTEQKPILLSNPTIGQW